ncbi:hypothetical protein KNE206_62710 [Kitasatospora sp. NE20-6]|uniref:hypothetical protein n=1 Tax=Kitasatospora sp. NE20-6 TaxID=2859066 RepID=UPI0034DC70FD
MVEFFAPGAVYRHFLDGRPSELGVFAVACVGRAPEGFAVPQEEGGVAFGWRRGVDAEGRGWPLGSYVTADFTGWREVPDAELPGLLGDVLPGAARLDLPRRVWKRAEPGGRGRWRRKSSHPGA